MDAARDEGAFASPAEVGRAWLRLLASQEARYTREREEDAIEAEDYWAQASSACAVDPIG
jgi:Arc/MetJ-type ribon-helix-helix transcriptional regulator